MTARLTPTVMGAVVVLCALLLRVALLPTARFGGDEALFFQIGSDIVEGVRFPLLGTQLTDGKALLPGPAFLYLMAAPLLVFRGPEAQYLFVEVLGAITVGVFWHAMRRPFGERPAFIAGVLMAFSPWSALYADRTWNPNVAPFFLTVAFLAALRVREDPRSRWLVALIPFTAILAQFHMSAPVAWLGLGTLVLPLWRRLSRRHLALGIACAALLYMPLLVHELTTDFSNIRNLIAETVGEKKELHRTSFLWIPVYALRFLTLDAMYHELTGYWGGPDEVACLKALLLGTTARPFTWWRMVALLCSLALALWALIAVARAARRQWRERREAPMLAIAFAAALVGNLLLLGATGKQVFGHYVTNLFPFVFVVYPSFSAQVLAHPRAWVRRVFLVLVLVFCLGGAEVTLGISRRVDGRIGLQVHRRTLERIRDDGAREGNTTEPVRLDFAYRSNLYDWSIFARRAMHMELRFDKKGTRRYRLVEKDKPVAVPDGAEGPIDVGHALLYRFR